MQVTRWFDRKFELGNKQYVMPSLIERLNSTTIRIQEKLKNVHPKYYGLRPGEHWSLLEQVGHLWDLEELWLRRLDAFMRGDSNMPAADLENRKTHEALHNSKSINVLLNNFNKERNITLDRLKTMSRDDAFRSAIHPRLQQEMTVQDLCMFVADHDDHHLAMMSNIIEHLRTQDMTDEVNTANGPFISLAAIAGREMIPGYVAQFVHTGNVTVGFWTVKAGAQLPAHNHIHEQISIVTKGEFSLTVNNQRINAKPGDVAVIPSNEVHSAVAITDCEIIDVFAPTRLDYL